MSPADPDNQVPSLITELSSRNGIQRQKARIALVKIGAPAVDALVEAASRTDGHGHWEATKALSLIATAPAVAKLVRLLGHEESSIRWMAAEGIVRAGRASLPGLLQALIDHADSAKLRDSAHHALHDLLEQKLDPATCETVRPLYAALSGLASDAHVTAAASEALKSL